MKMKFFVLLLTHHHHLGQFIGIQNDSFFNSLNWGGWAKIKKNSIILCHVSWFSRSFSISISFHCSFLFIYVFPEIDFYFMLLLLCVFFKLKLKNKKYSMEVCKLNLKIDVVHYTALFFSLNHSVFGWLLEVFILQI